MRSQEPQVTNGAAGDHADVEVREADGEKTAPREEHVALVQKGGEAPGFEAGAAESGAREAVKLASSEMAKRMAGKSVERKQDNVESEDERADSDAEVAVEEEGTNGVVPEETDKENREVKEIAMNILQDERKSRFATIIAACRFTYRAGWRIEEKGAVKRLAVVVTSAAKASAGENGHQ